MKNSRALAYITSVILILILISCSNAPNLKLDPESDEFYLYAKYLMTRNEEKVFSKLNSPEQRQKFIKNFWAVRNFTEDENNNEFKEEIMRRVEHAKRYYKDGVLPALKSDRAMVHIIMGPPDNVEKYYANARYGDSILKNNTILWFFRDSLGAESIRFVFTDKSNSGIFRLNLNLSSLELLSAMDRMRNFTYNKKEGPVSNKLIKFTPEYSDGKLHLSIATKNVAFERKGDKAVSRFSINVISYRPDGDFKTDKFKKEIIDSSEDLLNGKKDIKVNLDVERYPSGTQLDIMVIDTIGSSVYRKTIKVK